MRWKRLLPDIRFLGSSLALLWGWPYWLGSIAQVQHGGGGAGLVAGPMVILGALAYRSRKRRRMGLRDSTMVRRCLEGLTISAILAAWLLKNDLMRLMYEDPIPNFLIPVWIVAAYLCAGLFAARRVPTRPSIELQHGGQGGQHV